MTITANCPRGQLPNLAARASKIIALLASPVEAERYRAADATYRVLCDNKLSMHELVKAIADSAAPQYTVPTARHQPISQVRQLWNARASLGGWEHSFVKSIMTRLEQFGEKVILSPKQVATINQIHARYFGSQQRGRA